MFQIGSLFNKKSYNTNNAALKASREIAKALDPNSAQYSQATEQAQDALSTHGVDINRQYDGQVSLRKYLGHVKEGITGYLTMLIRKRDPLLISNSETELNDAVNLLDPNAKKATIADGLPPSAFKELKDERKDALTTNAPKLGIY